MYNIPPEPIIFSNSRFENMSVIRNRIRLEDFVMLSLIGKGTFAKVVLVRKVHSSVPYAMKIIKKKEVLKKKQQDYILFEKKILSEVDHPFIIKMAGCFQSPDRLYFLLEYCPGGDLYGLISKRHRFTEEQARFYAAQIILALEHLHQKNILYRDLKPENVLMDKFGYLKLTDFGLSSFCPDTQETYVMAGTPQYLAPEILDKLPHGKCVDYWCLGNIIYQMVVGYPAFFSASVEESYQKIRSQNPIYPPKTSTRLKSLLTGLFSKNPKERLGANGIQQIKQHSWFSKTNWSGILNKEQKSPFVPLIQEEYDISNFDQQFTGCEINSWEEKTSDQEQWDLSDFSDQNSIEENESVDSQSSSASFEMKAEEGTIRVE